MGVHGSNPEPLMFALGHERTFWGHVSTSAAHPKADISEHRCDVRFRATHVTPTSWPRWWRVGSLRD